MIKPCQWIGPNCDGEAKIIMVMKEPEKRPGSTQILICPACHDDECASLATHRVLPFPARGAKFQQHGRTR